MSTLAPVITDEVEVVSGNIDALNIGWGTETEKRSRDVTELENSFRADHLDERSVGRMLSGNTANPHGGKDPVNPD